VATSITNVNTVATDIANVNTNATNIASINTNATNITDIQNASANAAIATTKAAEAAVSATAAEAAFDSFDDRYLGSKAANPTVDNDGNALVAGALYFNTTVSLMKVYTGAAWYTVGGPFVELSGGNMTGNLTFGDSDEIIMGAAGDLTIFHNGTDSYIQDQGTGNLIIGSNGTSISIHDFVGSQDMAKFTIGGSAELYHNGVKKIETTATGVDVTGNIVVSGNVDGRDVAADGSKLDNIAANANNYVHPNHTGEVTSTGDGATVITDNVVDEANLKVSNTPTDGYFLSAQSGNTGGLTWAAVPAGYTDADVDTHLNTSTATSGEVLSWTGTDYDWIAAGGGGGGASAQTIDIKTADYTVVSGDLGKIIKYVGAGADRTVTLTAGATLGDGFHVTILNANIGADERVVIDANGTERFGWQNGPQTITLSRGELIRIIWDNTGGRWIIGEGGFNLAMRSDVNPSTSAAAGDGSSSAIAMGYNAQSQGSHSVAIGRAYASGTDSFAAAIANNTSSYGAQGTGSISIGTSSKSTALASTAVGYGALSTHVASSAFGTSATTTATNQIALGGSGITARISGAYTLPTSDGTNGQVLTTDGSGAVTFADAGGGAALELYAENPSSPTTPSATGTNAVAIGNGATSTQANAFSMGSSASATNSAALSLGTNSNASGFGATAIGGATASSDRSTAIGYNSSGQSAQAVTGAGAMALGGSYASGSNSFAAAITNNTSSYGATGAYSVAIGRLAKATGSHSLAIGGYNSLASGAAAVSIGGNQANRALGNASFCIGGWQAWNEASDDNSFAMGEGAKSAVKGKLAYAGGRFNSIGDAQGGQFILRADTTDATATVLTTNNSTAGSTNQIVAASDTCITFDGTITAMQNGAQAYASWKIEGLLVNDGGTTTLANSATTVIQNLSSWGMALSADNTNNALAITVTGEASHNILWVANIRTTEVTYA